MSAPQHNPSFIISGGGTGGHIFPALAIADGLKTHFPESKIHFVGALERMEMQRVPAHGYKITGLPITGLNRQQLLKNISFPFKLVKSLAICRFLLNDKKPDVVIGTGGFASGPLLWQAQRMGIPTAIQEQNSYPGITNKLLGKKAKAICVAYPNLDKWFPAESIAFTGNPIRQTVLQKMPEQIAARATFGLEANKPTILVLGGSLGARAINQAINQQLEHFITAGAQIIWQCGKLYEKTYAKTEKDDVKVRAFIDDMNAAYAAADLIISRAGAGTLSELAVVGKPAILIPSPNVAEDHQTHNARAFSEKGAAILLPENELENLSKVVAQLLNDTTKQNEMGAAIRALALPNATQDIVNQIIKLLP